jgi:methionyl-tRNA formyltransferase
MRIAFAGTPSFAEQALKALHESGHEIALVLTQPDRAAGRGLKLQPSAVKAYAIEHHLPIIQPTSLRLDGKYPDDAKMAQEALLSANIDVMVVAAYGLLLPKWTLDLPTFGCLNIHASLLPRWRGAAPIQRAIEAGDPQSGVCIMQMMEGLDTGPVLLQAIEPIKPLDTSHTLLTRLTQLGCKLIVQAVKDLPSLLPVPQKQEGVTYAHKITKEETHLSWAESALSLERKIRAFNPSPGTHFPWGLFDSPNLKVWQAYAILDDSSGKPQGSPGQVLGVSPAGIDVQCSSGVLRLTEVQLAGHKRMNCEAFLIGHPVRVGDQLKLLTNDPAS